jgi:hypothetical protein
MKREGKFGDPDASGGADEVRPTVFVVATPDGNGEDVQPKPPPVPNSYAPKEVYRDLGPNGSDLSLNREVCPAP